MLDQPSLLAFLTARKVYAFDPDTRALVAEVTYHPDGKVDMFQSGQGHDDGTWGVEGNAYWTRYTALRDGTLNWFVLDPLDDCTAQAYYRDGRRAFLLSHNPTLTSVDPSDASGLRNLDVPALRRLIREGSYTGHTAGLAAGRLQVNLAIMPERHALDFFRFCQRNPRPCPLVGVSDAGSRRLHTLGHDLFADTDAPAYAIYEHGVLKEYRSQISDLWQDDFVIFALGCSFTFEHAVMEQGYELRHVSCNTTVPMYRTTIQTEPAGPFGGGMVVSMRPFKQADIQHVTEISAEFPLAHGAPVHVGDPDEIGIADISKPEFGEPVPIAADEITVFWACGVTPQNAAIAAKLPLFISHRPGAMLITDVDERANPPVLS